MECYEIVKNFSATRVMFLRIETMFLPLWWLFQSWQSIAVLGIMIQKKLVHVISSVLIIGQCEAGFIIHLFTTGSVAVSLTDLHTL